VTDRPSTPAPSGGGPLTDDERAQLADRIRLTLPAMLPGYPERIADGIAPWIAARAAQPGTPTAVEALADQIAAHDAYRVNDDGWTVCICGHVAEGDDDDGSHARHVAAALAQVEAQPNEEELA
jgi:hypothetical protein